MTIVQPQHHNAATARIVSFVESHEHRCDVISGPTGNVFRIAVVECQDGDIVSHYIEYATTAREVKLALGY